MGPDAMWPTGRPILTTQTNSSTWLVNSGWADLVILTGLGERQLPTELREPGLSIGAVSSLANALADPSSGYVIGDHKKLATALGIGVKQARRFMKTARADFVRRWCGDQKYPRLLAWLPSSLDTEKRWRAANVHAGRPRNENGPEAQAAICLSRALEESQ